MRITLLQIAFAAALLALPAHAQEATRTWVSGIGDDVNPCSRTAPCKTFAGAISKTAAGGEISVLNPGDFGSVTINKSISIIANGAEGGILAVQTQGIIINAGPNDVVNLRGLIIEGAGTSGTTGVRFNTGGALTIQDCVIRGFTGIPGAGINVGASTTNARVFVTDTLITRNRSGVLATSIAPTGATAPTVSVFLDRVQIVYNAGIGVMVLGAKAVVRLNNSTVVGNNSGLSTAGLGPATDIGQIISFGNNAIANDQNGGLLTTTPLQ